MKRLLYLLALGVAAATLSKPPALEAAGFCENDGCSTAAHCSAACSGCSSGLTGGSGVCFFGAPPIEPG